MNKSISDMTRVVCRVKSLNAEDAIRELSARLLSEDSTLHNYFTTKEISELVIQREKSQSTGLGNGFAFPHARIDKWGNEPVVVVGLSDQGIEFNSLDKKPVHAVFMIISSSEKPYQVLQTMSAIVRALKGINISKESLSFDSVYSLLGNEDLKHDNVIKAEDVMRPINCKVAMDTSLEEATRVMHLNLLDVIPVVDKDENFVGELSCYDIFTMGMPDFFRTLPTISFVRNIDPFDRYFRVKGDLTVGDLAIRDVKPLKTDSTLLEVIFEMAVRGQQRLFIVNERNCLVGMIDRFCIVDKILFF